VKTRMRRAFYGNEGAPLLARPQALQRIERLARGFEGKLELEALGTLKVTNHFEQIARLRIPGGAEHAHQAFGGSFRDATELLKPDRRVDVVVQNRFSRIEISGQERRHAFPEECLPLFAVLPDAGLHRFLELARKGHRHVSCDLRFQ